MIPFLLMSLPMMIPQNHWRLQPFFRKQHLQSYNVHVACLIANALLSNAHHAKKDWHTECCNLTSVTPTVVKKLETHSWECPWCYHPAIQKPGDGHQPDISTNKTYDLFISNMA